MITPSPCKHCHSPSHTSLTCFSRPRKPLKKTGKVYKQWIATRKAWIKSNPPDAQGYYYCHYCHTRLLPSEITLDHIKPRSSHPELRYDHSNLVVSCGICNALKSSRSYENFLDVEK